MTRDELYGPPIWARRYGPRGRGSVPDPDLRVSDAERAEVADALSKHYADGRLDQTELDQRLQRAMSAKTRGDLAGLLSDLPPLTAPAPAAVEVRRRRGGFALLFVTMLIFAAAFTSAMWTWHFPWLLFAVIFFVFWRRSRGGWHRHRYWEWHGHGRLPSAWYSRRGPGSWV